MPPNWSLCAARCKSGQFIGHRSRSRRCQRENNRQSDWRAANWRRKSRLLIMSEDSGGSLVATLSWWLLSNSPAAFAGRPMKEKAARLKANLKAITVSAHLRAAERSGEPATCLHRLSPLGLFASFSQSVSLSVSSSVSLRHDAYAWILLTCLLKLDVKIERATEIETEISASLVTSRQLP